MNRNVANNFEILLLRCNAWKCGEEAEEGGGTRSSDKSARIERVARGVSKIICIIRVESFTVQR